MRTAAPIPRRFAIATGALVCALSMTLVVSGYGPQEPTDEDWPAVWAAAREVHAADANADPETHPDEALLARVSELTQVAQRHPGDARAELLTAWLARRAGRDHALSVPAEWPWRGVENWIAAGALALGPDRTRALVLALGEAGVEPTGAELLLAWNTGLEYATVRLEMGAAERVQIALHARYQTDWSAMNLAYTLHRSGQWERADEVMHASLELAQKQGRSALERADLWNNRGLIAFGAGHERLGRDCLGRALGLGSEDAALILARQELANGRVERARAGFRGLLLAPEPHAWALRGWGMSLLAGSAHPPAETSASPGSPGPRNQDDERR